MTVVNTTCDYVVGFLETQVMSALALVTEREATRSHMEQAPLEPHHNHDSALDRLLPV